MVLFKKSFMKTLFTLIKLFFLFFCTVLFAQYKITIDAIILDEYSNEPLSFAQVKINEKNIKAITNIQGQFHLEYDEANILESDIITFFHSEYNSVSTKLSEFYKLLKNTDKIYLIPLNKTNNKISDETTNQTKDYIFGTVSSEHKPLQGVSVMIKSSLKEVLTDVHGKYQIKSEEEDVLVFSFLGMKTQEISINEIKQTDVLMIADGTLLDEVEIFGEIKKDEKINLGFAGKKSFDEIGYDIKTMTSKDIKPHYNNLVDLLKGQFAGILIGGDPPKVSIPGRQGSINNNSAAIFDVDGGIYESFPPIDIQQIETITIIKSLAGTNKYGSLGRGGIVVVRTKTFMGITEETKKQSVLAIGNDYEEDLQYINALTTTPSYIKTLQNTISFEEAKLTYKSLKQTKDNLSIPFYINTSEYFFKWDSIYAMDILTYVEELAKDNAKALKTLAFKYEALSMYEEARLVYQRIAILRPIDAQSYRDLALIYNATGYYNEAFQLYKQMLSNSMEGVDFTGLQQPIIDELMHLLAFHRSKVNFKDLPADLLTAKFKQDLRIVFEWNDPNAEFELQFVNPQKKFFKWSHTKFDNRERMLDEIKKGYTTEAYIIDDAEAGEWIINIEALNEEPTINPNYLKYTIYKNYGLPNETKTIKVLQLENIKQKVTLDKFLYE